MKAGQFNIFEYLERLNEEAESGNLAGKDKEGLIIPDENKKSYDWLKKEYDAKQTEVKVEITGQGASFKPGYDLQTNLDSVKDFKPGMFGEAKPAKTGEAPETDEKKPSLDPKKDTPSFTKGEADAPKKELPKTNDTKDNIKNKEEHEAGESKEKEEKEEEKEEKEEKEESKEEKPEVKKIDLKTKKQ